MMSSRDDPSPRARSWPDALGVAGAPILLKLHLIFALLKANALLMYGAMAVGLEPGWMRGYPPYPTVDPNIAFTSEALGRRAAEQVLSGTLPFWNHFEGVGAPLLGEMQSAALFPLTWLLVLPGGQLWMHLALQVIGGLATWGVLRKLGCARVGSVAGAVAFAAGGAFAWLANAALNPVSFLPVVLLGVETVREQVGGGRRRGLAWIALGLAASLYAGFPEVAYLNGLLIGVWTLVRGAGLPRTAWAPFVLRVGAGALLGVALAAPLMVAFLDYLPHANLGGHEHGGFVQAHLSPAYLLALFAPYAYGQIFQYPQYNDFWGNVGGYAGCALAALAIYGALGRPQRALRVALAAWVAATLAFSYGAPGLGVLARVIPGLADAAFYRYIPPSWSFSLCVLAALGLSDLTAGRSRRALWGAMIATSLLGVAALLIAREHAVYLGGQTGRANIYLIAGLAVVATLAAGLIRTPVRLALALAAVLVLETGVYLVVPTLAWPRAGDIDRGSIAFLQANLGLQRVATTGPLSPNYGSYFGLATINHNDLPIPRDWTDYVARRLDAEANPVLFLGQSSADDLALRYDAYRAVGVRYVIVGLGVLETPPFAALAERVDRPGAPFRRAYRGGAMEILELSQPAPYFDAPGCTLRPVSRDRVATTCAQPSRLRRAELFMDGWRAEVGGAPAPITRTEEIFQAVVLPAGASTVTFSFRPPYIEWAFAIALLGALLLVANRVWPSRRQASTEPDRAPAFDGEAVSGS